MRLTPSDSHCKICFTFLLRIGLFDKIDDFSGELIVLARIKQIGTDIIARMLYDYLECELLTLKAIPGFNVNSVNYEMLGPVFDNDFGVMFSFRMQNLIDLGYDTSKWISS